MAFQQQHKRPAPARQNTYATSSEQNNATAQNLSLQHAQTINTLAASEEWVLFSPVAPSVTQTHTTSTDRTPRTQGLSRFSEYGSLDTAARSDLQTEAGDNDDNGTEQATDADELDSLDDGLHAFHEPSETGSPRQMLQRSGDTVLPTHDGLGTFGGASDALQTQLWQYERDAQRRKHRRRASSVQRTLEALEEVEEVSEETERFRRIERWRLEQSRALLEEIERETRRMRRLSRATSFRSQSQSNYQTKSETNFSSGVASPAVQEVPVSSPAPPASVHEENEGFWQRITRRVIRDLIGIDENILSVILGESLPEEAYKSPASSTHDISKDKVLETVEEDVPFQGETWQHRLLERVARELGILVHQLSEHPGAFTTYLKAAETPSYAGITGQQASSAPSMTRRASSGNVTVASPSAALFNPTLGQQAGQSDPSLWGIEEEPTPEEMLRASASLDNAMLQRDREYWERELDIKMVFQFLKNKFSSRPSSPTPAEGNPPYVGGYQSPSRRASAYSITSAAGKTSAQRAALIRQHHPLTSKLDNQRKKDLSHRHHTHHHNIGGVAPQNAVRSRLGVRTRSDSCASQSTKRSRKSGSSRNFWDIGGSVNSGPAGPGAWGEVGI